MRRQALSECVLILTLMGMGLPTSQAADPASIAKTIDARLMARFQEAQITPAPAADDAEFLRRVHLDLIGRPPSPDMVRMFLAEASTSKRSQMVDALLADPRHADHFAMTWRALLLPEADSDAQLRYFQPGLEAWLRQKSLDRVGFDVLVRELLSVPIAGPNAPPQMVLRDLKQRNPWAFLASKNGDPATIAASATRLFLGVRLECAQCHNHPFEAWTQTQFWNQAAFFAGIERRGRSPFSPLVENRERREIAMMDRGETVPAVFLNGEVPTLDAGTPPRVAWADWMTAKENSRFSQALVNRVWGQLMGEGLVDPVDDFGAGNPPSDPDLLHDLAVAFVEADFQMQTLFAGICLSEAYQRTSRTTHPSQVGRQIFARMALKPMTGEQFFATAAQAIDYTPQSGRLGAGRDEDPVRRRILNEFATTGQFADPETSVSQALTLMNGRLINDAVAALSEQAPTDAKAQSLLEPLFLKTLSRFPTSDEQTIAAAHLDAGSSQERPRRLGDILWALLNSAEFRWNH